MILLSDVTWYDPAWIAVYIAIVAIIVATVTSLVLYRKQLNRKEISYGAISATSLLSVSEEVRGMVQVLYGGNPVSNVRLVTLRIWNSGNLPIETKDYENQNPIKFDFGSSSEILDIQVTEKIPANLKVTLAKEIDKFLLEPFLLNKKESLTIKILLSSSTNEVIVDTRIIGTEQIAVTREGTNAFSVMEGVAKAVRTSSFSLMGTQLIFDVAFELFWNITQKFARSWLQTKQRASNIRGPLALDIKDRPR